MLMSAVSATPAPSGGRRLRQAIASDPNAIVDVLLRVASGDPAGVEANATSVLTPGGTFDKTVLSTYGLSLVGAPTLTPFMDGTAMQVGADGDVVTPATPAAGDAAPAATNAPTPAGASSSSSGLSTGAIVGIAVGAAAALALAAAAAVVIVRRRRAARAAGAKQWTTNPAHESEAADCVKMEGGTEGGRRPITAVATSIGATGLPDTP